MIQNRVIILILCAVILACNNNKPKKPERLIPKDKMVALLYDLYVINSAKGVNRKLIEDKGIVPETYILTKHNIDSIQFVESNSYYAFDPENYKSIIDKVKSKLEQEKSKYQKLQKIEDSIKKHKRDSLRKTQLNKLKTKDTTKVIEQPKLISPLKLDAIKS